MSQRSWPATAGICVLLIGAAVTGVLAYRWLQPAPPPAPADLASLQFTDLQGNPVTLAAWQDKLLLVNFWASWCAPCRKEIPMLTEVQQEYGPQGFQIVGPAMDEPDVAAQLAEVMKINYPVFAGSTEIIQAMDALGDQIGALPFSVLIRPDGTVVMRHSGELQRDSLVALIETNL